MEVAMQTEAASFWLRRRRAVTTARCATSCRASMTNHLPWGRHVAPVGWRRKFLLFFWFRLLGRHSPHAPPSPRIRLIWSILLFCRASLARG